MASVTNKLDFIEEVIKKFLNNEKLQVLDVKSEALGEKGSNYMSETSRIHVTYKFDENHEESEENLSLFMKKMYKIDDEYFKKSVEKAFWNEDRVMSGPLKSMSQKNGSIVTPRLLYSSLEEPNLIVMEDLRPQKFVTVNRLTSLDLVHASLAIRSLARFHANSVAVREEVPEYGELFRHSMYTDNDRSASNFIEHGMNSLAAEIATWEELGPKYAEKLRNLSKSGCPRIINDYISNDNEFEVLNHGDFQQSNILFKYDNENKPIECAFVDFQFSNYNSPGIDLQYFMATSLAYEVYDNHRYSLLEEYHLELSRAMKSLNCKTSIPSLKDITRLYHDKNFVNLITTCLIEPIIHDQSAHITDLEDKIAGNGLTYLQQSQSEDYRKMLITRLKEYEKLGLFEE